MPRSSRGWVTNSFLVCRKLHPEWEKFSAYSLDNELVTPVSVLGCGSLINSLALACSEAWTAVGRHNGLGAKGQESLTFWADGGIGRRASLRN